MPTPASFERVPIGSYALLCETSAVVTSSSMREGVKALVLVCAGLALGAATPVSAAASGSAAVMWLVVLLAAIGVVIVAYREPRFAAFSATFAVVAIAVASAISMASSLQSFH
jgi:hypothetical protein